MKDFKNHNPYKVPDNYFDSLEQAIINKTTKSKFIISWRTFAVAASFLLVALSFFFTIYKDNSEVILAKKEQMVYNRLYDLYIVEDHEKSPVEMENDSIRDFYSDDLLFVME